MKRDAFLGAVLGLLMVGATTLVLASPASPLPLAPAVYALGAVLIGLLAFLIPGPVPPLVLLGWTAIATTPPELPVRIVPAAAWVVGVVLLLEARRARLSGRPMPLLRSWALVGLVVVPALALALLPLLVDPLADNLDIVQGAGVGPLGLLVLGLVLAALRLRRPAAPEEASA